MAKALGTVGKIPPTSFLSLQLRTRALEAKHFSYRNASVANRSSVAKIVAGEGSVQVGGFEKEFYLPETVGEIIEAIMNYQAALFQTFPYDYTGLVLMRVAQEYDFFSLVEDQKKRVLVFDAFFTSVLKANAAAPHKPPADYAEVCELASMALQRFNFPGMKPVETTFFMTQSTEYARQVARANQHGNTALKDKRTRAVPSPKPVAAAAAKKRQNVVGKLPVQNEYFKMGKDVVCKQYQQDKCKREAVKGGCKLGGIECVHKCATIKVVRADNTTRLCGLLHPHINCPDKA